MLKIQTGILQTAGRVFPMIFITILLCAPEGNSQEIKERPQISNKSISLSGGASTFAVRDGAISNERYSGSMTSFNMLWSNYRDNRGFLIGFDLNSGTQIEHRNLSSEITIFNLRLDYLHALKPITLFNKNTWLYLGPSTGAFFYIREQNIAVSDNGEDAVSVLSTIPLGIRTKAIIMLSQRLVFETDLYLDIISFALRYPSNSEEELDARLLHPINGLKSELDFSLKYKMVKWMSVFLALKQQVVNVSSWDEDLLYGNSNVVVGLEIGFGSISGDEKN